MALDLACFGSSGVKFTARLVSWATQVIPSDFNALYFKVR